MERSGESTFFYGEARNRLRIGLRRPSKGTSGASDALRRAFPYVLFHQNMCVDSCSSIVCTEVYEETMLLAQLMPKKKARDLTHMHVYTYMLERKFSNIIHEELPTSKQAAHIESVNYTYYTPRISQEKKLLYID
jgi:hypothetical protein